MNNPGSFRIAQNQGRWPLPLGKIVMLVLTRCDGEAIVINGEIVVSILEIRGNQVCLGIEAPKEIPVLRAELIDSKGDLIAADRTDTPFCRVGCGVSSLMSCCPTCRQPIYDRDGATKGFPFPRNDATQ